jgi:hypothetical protein
MFKCNKCNQDFKSNSGLVAHLKKRVSCDTPDKKCINPNCNNKAKYPNKFCSQKCAGIVNSPGRKHSEETRKKISITQGGTGVLINYKKQCLNCGKSIPKKFCNNTCKSEYILNNLIKDWLDGKINGNSKGGHASYVKKYLLKKYNNKCSKCGWGEINIFSKSIPLEVEHMDGNPYNNNPNNVDLLCPNCHSLTKTYRGGNKGNGRREYLKKYYIKDSHGNII